MNFLIPNSRVVGAAPLFRQVADDIGLVDMVNRSVRWDARQCHVSPGERLLVMVLDLLLGKSPLYRMAERWTTTDVAVLIGADRLAADLSDDSLGRALDKLARAQPARIFSAVAAQAYMREGVTLHSGHFDTTSRSLTGTFDHGGSAPVQPAFGHSKDARPDLKQIVLTLFVNREGVPLAGTVESGNRSDKTLNAEMVDRVVAAMEPEQLAQLIYVADSALVTGPNLARLDHQGVAFVSRCPDTFGIVSTLKQAAWATDQWIAIGPIGQRRQAAHYGASEQVGEIDGRHYRCVVYRSSVLDPRRAKTLDREIQRSRTALEQSAF
nr:IS1634 family transposase [Sulfobacillus thermosulfidooxidans]